MTPQEQYKIDLAKWSEDIAVWQKAQKAWVESVVKLSKNPSPNPGQLQGHQFHLKMIKPN